MENGFIYVSSARWTDGRNGVATGPDVQRPIKFSAPPEFQGEAGVWTPEHFFTTATAACFVNTFQAIAMFSEFSVVAFDVSVDGKVENGEGGYRFTRVTLRPVLTVPSEADRERGMRLLEKAEKACLVSRSLNSEMILEAKILEAVPTV